MFESLSEKLDAIFSRLKGRGLLKEEDIQYYPGEHNSQQNKKEYFIDDGLFCGRVSRSLLR